MDLCAWVEKQCAPVQKRSAKHALGVPDAPYEASEWLRCVFKSHSIRIKSAAARNEAATMLIKSWYIDHLAVGHNMMTTRVVQSAAAALQPPSITTRQTPALPTPPAKRQRNDKAPGKGKGKDVPSFNKNVLDKITHGPMEYRKLPDTLEAFIRPNLNVTQAN